MLNCRGGNDWCGRAGPAGLCAGQSSGRRRAKSVRVFLCRKRERGDEKFIPGGGGNSITFPSRPICNGMGELAFQVGKKIVTDGLSAQAKAAKAAGKSATVALVADELMTVYSALGAIAQYNQVVGELESLPERK